MDANPLPPPPMLPTSTKDTDGAAQPFPTTPIIDTVPLPLPPMSLTTTAALANTHLTSYESDPNLSKTVYYSTPANPSHPLVQYTGVVTLALPAVPEVLRGLILPHCAIQCCCLPLSEAFLSDPTAPHGDASAIRSMLLLVFF